MNEYSKKILQEAVKDSFNWIEVCKKLGKNRSTHTVNPIKRDIVKYGIDISHFDFYKKNKERRIHPNVIKQCLVCFKTFQTLSGIKKEKKYCSRKCCNSLKLGNRHSKQSHVKTSITMSGRPKGSMIKREKIFKKCQFCGENFYKTNKQFCSQSCSTKFLWSTSNYKNKMRKGIQDRIKRGEHKGWKVRNTLSYPEKFFKKVLELNGFKGKFFINYPIKKSSLGFKCGMNYFLDFYFPDFKLDLEIDGKQHEILERKKSDLIRDNALLENGYKIYRIKWKSLNTKEGKNSIKNEIQKFLDFMKAKQL